MIYWEKLWDNKMYKKKTKRRKSSMQVLLNMLKLCSWHWISLCNMHFCNPTMNLTTIARQIVCPQQLQQISKTASAIIKPPLKALVITLYNQIWF
jgi:hypothetical protein